MNDNELLGLLTRFRLIQNDLTRIRILGRDYGKEAKLFTERDNTRNAITSGFAALRQQRDKLAEACRAFVTAWERSHQLEKTDLAIRLAHAALASIEGAE